MQPNERPNITPDTPEVKTEIENIRRFTMTKADTVLKVPGGEPYRGQDGYEPYYIAQRFISRFRYETRRNFNKHRHKLIQGNYNG